MDSLRHLFRTISTAFDSSNQMASEKSKPAKTLEWAEEKIEAVGKAIHEKAYQTPSLKEYREVCEAGNILMANTPDDETKEEVLEVIQAVTDLLSHLSEEEKTQLFKKETEERIKRDTEGMGFEFVELEPSTSLTNWEAITRTHQELIERSKEIQAQKEDILKTIKMFSNFNPQFEKEEEALCDFLKDYPNSGHAETVKEGLALLEKRKALIKMAKTEMDKKSHLPTNTLYRLKAFADQMKRWDTEKAETFPGAADFWTAETVVFWDDNEAQTAGPSSHLGLRKIKIFKS